MPFLFLRRQNDRFDQCDEGTAYTNLVEAKRALLDAASGLASRELCSGQPSVFVAAQLETSDGRALYRVSVTISHPGRQVDAT